MSTEAEVHLWGRMIGAVLIDDGARAAVFQYDPDFARSAIEVAPLTMPLRPEPYSFPDLPGAAFRGLPGLLADSLPDRWGNALIDTWLAGQGRAPGSADAVERLRYIGTRGMGALEFRPAMGPARSPAEQIHVGELVRLASEILTQRDEFVTELGRGKEQDAMLEILSVGMSAGGARAKAVIAWEEASGEIRSGQVDAPPGFEHWLLKFDGVSGNRDKEALDDPEGYGAIEYAYHLMATAAGVEMMPCRLLGEGPRRHFMTRRFDRPAGNARLHMQSLAALAHYDFNRAGAYSCEAAIGVIRRLGLPAEAVEQQFRRMAFNVVARNQDDHVKNIAFLMDQGGDWSLAPAFDVTFAYRADGEWTSRHQMTVNGKRDDFTVADFERCADAVSMQRSRARAILDEVREAVAEWPRYAAAAAIPDRDAAAIGASHRLDIPRR